MTKEFKVLKMTISDDNNTGASTLLAELSEIKEIEIEALQSVAQLFSITRDFYFLLDSNSIIAEYLLNNPEERKFIDMSLYKEGTFFLDNKLEKAYKPIPPRNPDPNHWTNIEIDM